MRQVTAGVHRDATGQAERERRARAKRAGAGGLTSWSGGCAASLLSRYRVGAVRARRSPGSVGFAAPCLPPSSSTTSSCRFTSWPSSPRSAVLGLALLVARGDAGAHHAQVRVARTVVTPAGRWRCWPASTWPATARYWSEVRVSVAAGHPDRADGHHRRLLRPPPGAARRAGRGGAGPEYAALATQVARVAFAAAGLVVVAIFFMVTKTVGASMAGLASYDADLLAALEEHSPNTEAKVCDFEVRDILDLPSCTPEALGKLSGHPDAHDIGAFASPARPRLEEPGLRHVPSARPRGPAERARRSALRGAWRPGRR